MAFELGNQLAKNRDRGTERRFKAALNQAIEKNKGRLDLVAEALLDKAASGDVPAIKELADRLDGKVTQPIDGDGEGGPIQHALTVHFVGRSNPGSIPGSV